MGELYLGQDSKQDASSIYEIFRDSFLQGDKLSRKTYEKYKADRRERLNHSLGDDKWDRLGYNPFCPLPGWKRLRQRLAD